MRVRRAVAAHQLGRQGTHITVGLIKRKSFGQAESRLEGQLIVRT
jgi:hypothetical protein